MRVMCGRYVVAYDPATLVVGFSVVRAPPFPRRFNVAPQSEVPVVHVTREGERVATLMRWGLVPHWARDPALGHKLNNARAETVFDKPSFRQGVRRRRCLLPASGFYEWQPGPTPRARKQPWYFSALPGSPASPVAPDVPDAPVSPLAAGAGTLPLLAMAGLFEAWRPNDQAEWLLTCCVLTTDANALMAPVHDRMPVLLARDDWARWLDRERQDPDEIAPLLRPCPPEWLQAWPVSPAVSPGSAEGPALIEPLAEPTAGAAR
jgi:putative SOS response-associated peptidase YedK